MIFVAYYTEGDYTQVANTQLIPTLKWWNLKNDVLQLPKFENWQHATGYKSQFILDMLEKHEESVCCVDVDAEILRFPELLLNIPEKYDLAYCNLDWFYHWRGEKGNDKRELLSGTIYFNYSFKVLELIKLWRKNVLENINTQEQLILQRIVESSNNYKILNLPVEYCTILRHDNTIPNYIKYPVILHTQASRQLKHKR